VTGDQGSPLAQPAKISRRFCILVGDCFYYLLPIIFCVDKGVRVCRVSYGMWESEMLLLEHLGWIKLTSTFAI
jgi:hypothetical protein